MRDAMRPADEAERVELEKLGEIDSDIDAEYKPSPPRAKKHGNSKKSTSAGARTALNNSAQRAIPARDDGDSDLEIAGCQQKTPFPQTNNFGQSLITTGKQERRVVNKVSCLKCVVAQLHLNGSGLCQYQRNDIACDFCIKHDLNCEECSIKVQSKLAAWNSVRHLLTHHRKFRRAQAELDASIAQQELNTQKIDHSAPKSSSQHPKAPPITQKIQHSKAPPSTQKIQHSKAPPITQKIDHSKAPPSQHPKDPPSTQKIDHPKAPPITQKLLRSLKRSITQKLLPPST
ncbi:hypothetical protein SUNI508_09667 [Seiridium unicorne]|uniref:Uncharacterized protein n=1 Tax=Seiridium unicorne TaxID=138068 RepID=A0ABR2UQH1_9PEZI